MDLQDKAELPWHLRSPIEIGQMGRDYEVLSEIVNWVSEYLAQPHLNLGRPGPVCPFVPHALQLDTMWMAVARMDAPEKERIKEVIAAYRDVFLNLEPTTGEDALYKAILIILPDIALNDAPVLIDGVQKELKPFFVEQGMMIGEFHELNPSPGLHNPNFFPLRSPIPMLAMRFMVESDLVFLMRELDTAEARLSFLKSFLQRFESKLPEKKLTIARHALAQAEMELQVEEHRCNAPTN